METLFNIRRQRTKFYILTVYIIIHACFTYFFLNYVNKDNILINIFKEQVSVNRWIDGDKLRKRDNTTSPIIYVQNELHSNFTTYRDADYILNKIAASDEKQNQELMPKTEIRKELISIKADQQELTTEESPNQNAYNTKISSNELMTVNTASQYDKIDDKVESPKPIVKSHVTTTTTKTKTTTTTRATTETTKTTKYNKVHLKDGIVESTEHVVKDDVTETTTPKHDTVDTKSRVEPTIQTGKVELIRTATKINDIMSLKDNVQSANPTVKSDRTESATKNKVREITTTTESKITKKQDTIDINAGDKIIEPSVKSEVTKVTASKTDTTDLKIIDPSNHSKITTKQAIQPTSKVTTKQAIQPTNQQTTEQVSQISLSTDYIPPFQCLHQPFNHVYGPCNDKTSWKLKSDDKSVHTNLTFSNIEINTKPPNELSHLKITTYNNLKELKTTGGDSWWIKVIGKYSFHIDIIDNADGTYESWFSFVRPGIYSLEVELIWSECDGLRDPPEWWFSSGKHLFHNQSHKMLPINYYYLSHSLVR